MADLENLLQSISADEPSGPDLRLLAGDTTIDDIQGLRQVVDPIEDPEGRGKDPDWPGTIRACLEALQSKTKDLEVAAYLVEARARTEGFAGVAESLQLINELLVRFWDSLHPGSSEEQDLAIRARWISWLGTSRDFLGAVKSIPLTPGGPDARPLSWADYEQTDRVMQAKSESGARYAELIASGAVSREQWIRAIGAVLPDRLESTIEVIKKSTVQLRALRTTCEEKFRDQDPNLVPLNDFFTDCAEHLSERLNKVTASSGNSPATPMESASSAGGGGGAPAGPIGGREQAYQRLREIADFLKRTEPHSPVAYLIERAVKWGEMPFKDLVLDVVKQKDARSHMFETLGLPDPQPRPGVRPQPPQKPQEG